MKLPPRPAPRDRGLTRNEATTLLRAARNNPQDRARHLCRFILTALYTGTRSSAILGLRFMPRTTGGWVNTERGIMHPPRRRNGGDEETATAYPDCSATIKMRTRVTLIDALH